MAIPVKRIVRVIEAEYVAEADSICVVCECSDGKVRNQIHSSCFTFGDKNKEEEMKKLAGLMIGKNINMVFDTELDGKIKDHYPLKY